MTGMWTLGIDFGTSFTVVAVYVDGRPEPIEIDGQRRTPSVVLVDEDGGIRVGSAAEGLAATRPGRTLREPKRRLGEPAPVLLGGTAHSVVDLVGELLRYVYDAAVRYQGSEPAEVRLTHPASWGRPRLAELRRAAAIAGMREVTLVPEPVAAAVAYASESDAGDDGFVAVYDLGGGTFDTAVLRHAEGGFVIQGRPGGDQHLGGELFDELLAQHVATQLPEDAQQALIASDDLIWRQAAAGLRTSARTAKEQLSTQDYAELIVALPTGMVPIRVERAELEALIEPHIAETIDVLARTASDADVATEDLGAIYLTGGASRTPLVEARIRDAFPGVDVLRRADPKLAVAIGATLPAAARALDVTSPIAVIDEPTHVRRTIVSTQETPIVAEPVSDLGAEQVTSDSLDEVAPIALVPTEPVETGATRIDAAPEPVGPNGATVIGSSLAAGAVSAAATSTDADGAGPPAAGPIDGGGDDDGQRSRKMLLLIGAAAAVLLLLVGITVAVAQSGGGDDSATKVETAALKRRPRTATTTTTTTTLPPTTTTVPVVAPPATPTTTVPRKSATPRPTTPPATSPPATSPPATSPPPPPPAAPTVSISGPSVCALRTDCYWQAHVSNATSGSWASNCGGSTASWPASGYYRLNAYSAGSCLITLTVNGPGGSRTATQNVQFV